jgi:organic hydroperoxide reductase OsmC/OhrA
MKKAGQFLFESQLKWTEDTKGIITSRMAAGPIKVATPRVFNGVQGGLWSPEHLLINAVSSCFMTTYLYFAKHKGLPVSGFECEAIGQVELINGKLKFTTIHVYPKIGIEKPEWTGKVNEVIELTKQNCLITNALNIIVYYHPSVEVKPHTTEIKQQQNKKKWLDIY